MSNDSTAPLQPIASAKVPWTEFDEVPRFSLRYRHLTRALLGDDYRVGVAIEELRPGSQSAPAHYHIFEEEHLYILEGALTLRLGPSRFAMKAGDYVCFPAGQCAGHCLLNEGDSACCYVIIGENNRNEIAVYTDTAKVLVRALGPRALFDMAAMRHYWEGEDTGLADGALPRAGAANLAEQGTIEPRPPISASKVSWQETDEGVRVGGRTRHLTQAAVDRNYRVGVRIEAPAPGKRLAPRHYHMLEEEHALVLDGQVMLLLGDDKFEMTAGEYVCFPAGRKVPHAFMNAGPDPCSYLMIGENNPNEVCVYPDSNKMAVSALRSWDDIFDMSVPLRYWHGEDVG